MRRRFVAAVLSCAALAVAGAQAQTLTTEEAKEHIGETATVCGKVLSPRFASFSRGQPTFLNLDKAYPSPVFTVLIWGTDRPKFGAPEVAFRDKNICVTGAIRAYRGAAEIIATDPKQIRLQ